jgi:hypothetical protein
MTFAVMTGCSRAPFDSDGHPLSSTEQALTSVNGNTKWLVVLCQIPNTPAPPASATQAYYQKLFATSGAGGVFDYWSDQSYKRVDLTGTFVTNWMTSPDSPATINALVAQGRPGRGQLIADCVNTVASQPASALGGTAFGSFFNYVALYNWETDNGDSGQPVPKAEVGNASATIAGRSVPAVLGGVSDAPQAFEHEMGHGFGLNHSYRDTLQNCGGGPGEYCDLFDNMSEPVSYSFNSSWCSPVGANCNTGPGLDMWNRHKLGWTLENSESGTPAWPNNYGSYTQTFTLASRGHPELVNGTTPMMLFVEAHQDSNYTVEFVSSDGWDRGIAIAPSIHLDRIYNGNDTPYALFEPGGLQMAPGQPFNEGSVKIALQSIQGSPPTATVRVSYSPGFASAFVPWTQGVINGQYGTFIADVTGDGAGDLVALNNNSVSVMPSTRSNFAPVQQWANYTFNGTYGNFVADVTGDGKADLVAAANGYLAVAPATPQGRGNTGTGFGSIWTMSETALNGQTNFVADVTGDGKADVVNVNASGQTIVYVSTSSDTQISFNSQIWTQSAGLGQFGTLLADVNGDKKADLVLLNNNSVTVMPSTGSNWGAAQTWVNQAFYGMQATFLSDVTGDGMADLVAINSGGQNITLGVSTGVSFALETWSTLTAPSTSAVGDVNGDGMADIIAFSTSTNVTVLPAVLASPGVSPPSNPLWTAIPGCASQVASGWVIGCDHNSVFQWVPSANNWHQQPLPSGSTALTAISVDLDGTPWLVANTSAGNGQIYRWTGNAFAAISMTNLGCAESVASGGISTETWAAKCSDNTIWQWNGSTWQQVQPGIIWGTKVAMFSTPDSTCGHVPFVIGTDGNIYRYSCGSRGFVPTNGGGPDITTDFFVGTEGSIYQWNPVALKWQTPRYIMTPGTWGPNARLGAWNEGIFVMDPRQVNNSYPPNMQRLCANNGSGGCL